MGSDTIDHMYQSCTKNNNPLYQNMIFKFINKNINEYSKLIYFLWSGLPSLDGA